MPVLTHCQYFQQDILPVNLTAVVQYPSFINLATVLYPTLYTCGRFQRQGVSSYSCRMVPVPLSGKCNINAYIRATAVVYRQTLRVDMGDRLRRTTTPGCIVSPGTYHSRYSSSTQQTQSTLPNIIRRDRHVQTCSVQGTERGWREEKIFQQPKLDMKKNEKRCHVKGETDGKYVCQLPACHSQWLTQSTHHVVDASISLARAERRI